ncbi:MAG: hypothetical protein GC206_08260 [Alphaproteobacteria bacterium]|nr:hypothetical protein [Alphaproteobacteria bacterium]
MAFTDMEIREAHDAVTSGAAHSDLYKLGLIYSTGNGAEVDLVEAHKWFNLAALRGSDAAKDCRRELADQMTSAQIADAQRAAREWLKKRH